YHRGIRSALLEGGPTLAGSFVRARLVDRVIAYLAPKLLGGGPGALGPAGVGTLADAVELDITDVSRVGPDIRITGVPRSYGQEA
ncbi:MAG TPA: dihydrofolate reductase family protein, partial [Micromonosporaceae bacterium]|nr:dihydrofolate reductase family protein [Micromonosporaceae bacterium]